MLHSQREEDPLPSQKNPDSSPGQGLFKSLKSFPSLSVGQFEERQDDGCWPTKVVLPVTMMP